MGICQCTFVQALVWQSLRPGARIDFLSKSDTPCILEKNMKKGFLGVSPGFGGLMNRAKSITLNLDCKKLSHPLFNQKADLGGGFKYFFLFSPLFGEDFQFD